MVKLHNVHLISAIGGGHTDVRFTAGAMNICFRQCEFGRATLMTHTDRPTNLLPDIEHLKIPPMGLPEYNKFMLIDLFRYVREERVMIVQHDGFIVNPNAWLPEMLNYDYIGAVWPVPRPQVCRVGNGGFSIRSHRLQEAVSKAVTTKLRPYTGNNEDEYICNSHREFLEQGGFTFAPSDLASRFSVEFKSWHHEDLGGLVPFGFHGFYDGRDHKYHPLLRKELIV